MSEFFQRPTMKQKPGDTTDSLTVRPINGYYALRVCEDCVVGDRRGGSSVIALHNTDSDEEGMARSWQAKLLIIVVMKVQLIRALPLFVHFQNLLSAESTPLSLNLSTAFSNLPSRPRAQ